MTRHALPDDSPKKIPDELQQKARKKLQVLRQTKGLGRDDFSAVTSGTVCTYELHDISTMQFGVLYSIAKDFGMTLEEILFYLFGDEELDSRDGSNCVRSVTTVMRGLAKPEQEVIVDVVMPLADHFIQHARGQTQAA